MFAQIIHHSIPGLSQPVRDKLDLPKIFGGTMITTTVVYASVGG